MPSDCLIECSTVQLFTLQNSGMKSMRQRQVLPPKHTTCGHELDTPQILRYGGRQWGIDCVEKIIKWHNASIPLPPGHRHKTLLAIRVPPCELEGYPCYCTIACFFPPEARKKHCGTTRYHYGGVCLHELGGREVGQHLLRTPRIHSPMLS
ncbi:unnamed protein product, partial [Ectocarpus fasciculatus]